MLSRLLRKFQQAAAVLPGPVLLRSAVQEGRRGQAQTCCSTTRRRGRAGRRGAATSTCRAPSWTTGVCQRWSSIEFFLPSPSKSLWFWSGFRQHPQMLAQGLSETSTFCKGESTPHYWVPVMKFQISRKSLHAPQSVCQE